LPPQIEEGEEMKRRERFVSTGLIFLFVLVFISGCKKDEETAPAPPVSLYYFSFLKEHNPGLPNDLKLTAYGNRLVGTVPPQVDIRQMVASFTFTGLSVSVDGKVQNSGVTVNDFSQVLTYRVTNQDGDTEEYEVDVLWFTGFPMIYLETENNQEINSVDNYVTGHASISGGRHHPDNSGSMKIRGRGHSTWFFHPKKPYQLKFDDKTEMLGMPAKKRWIFLAEFSDKTLIRNRLAFEMGHISNLDWTPRSEYAEVYVNNEHMGVYHVTEKVEEGEDRVDIGKKGFLLEIDVEDHLKPDDIYFHTSEFLIQIKEPELETGSEDYHYIKDYINDFETALFSSNFLDAQTGYKSYIELDSFVDWYLINEIAKNQDARDYSSMYMHLVPGKKLKMGPIWDFDLGFGNVDYSDCQFPTHFWVRYHAWIDRMFDDPEFVAKVKNRFAYFRDNEAYLMGFIDQTAASLDLAQKENDDKWDLIGRWVWPNPYVFNTYQEEVDHLKNWLGTRMDWLDEVYGSM
jgi:spore coat protein CotH